jgi:deoxyribodipyrimidine photo-lyase
MDVLPIDTGAEAKQKFATFCAAQTGYPIVDAGIRQMLVTGWMHNRVRMIVASFLVKDLHVPWQWGAKFFMKHLVDGDIASNNHGWQWTAGTGTDASPYYRVFNPTTQSAKFDPTGSYLREWVPEIADLDNVSIHDPSSLGLLAPVGYPAPMVDHSLERIESLARYKAVSGK